MSLIHAKYSKAMIDDIFLIYLTVDSCLLGETFIVSEEEISKTTFCIKSTCSPKSSHVKGVHPLNFKYSVRGRIHRRNVLIPQFDLFLS